MYAFFKWYPKGNFPLIHLHQYENLSVRFGHLSWVSAIPQMKLGHPTTKQKLRFGHPLMKFDFFVWPCVIVYTKILWSGQRYASNDHKACKYHPLKTCSNDGITFGKFLPSEASAMLGCPKLEFRAPVGAPCFWGKLKFGNPNKLSSMMLQLLNKLQLEQLEKFSFKWITEIKIILENTGFSEACRADNIATDLFKIAFKQQCEDIFKQTRLTDVQFIEWWKNSMSLKLYHLIWTTW